MSSEEQSLLVPSLVYFGAAVLIGIPAAMVLFWGFGTVLSAIGLERALASPPILAFLFFGLSLLIGLQLAVEAAAVQLGGVEALGRGSPRVALVRYVVFSLGVFLLLAAVTWVGLSTALAGFGWEAVVLGLLVGLAGLVVLYRSSRAFVAGLRSSES